MAVAAVEGGTAAAPKAAEKAPAAAAPAAPPPLPASALLLEPAVLDVLVASYEGERDARSGLPEGQGAAVFRGGARYEGAWARGVLHGRGRYEWPDGVRYEGDFVANEVKGHGTYTWPGEGGATYVGQVDEGLRCVPCRSPPERTKVLGVPAAPGPSLGLRPHPNAMPLAL